MQPDSRKRKMSKKMLNASEESILRDSSKRESEERRKRRSKLKEKDFKDLLMKRRLRDLDSLELLTKRLRGSRANSTNSTRLRE